MSRAARCPLPALGAAEVALLLERRSLENLVIRKAAAFSADGGGAPYTLMLLLAFASSVLSAKICLSNVPRDNCSRNVVYICCWNRKRHHYYCPPLLAMTTLS